MKTSSQFSLRPYNTFGIEAKARHFIAFSSPEQLQEALEAYPREPLLILGGGSNILLTGNFNGLVAKNELKGIELVREDADHYYVKAQAGENWHGFVQYCLRHQYAGVENLSLIPGNVGASPMQNIGAYGVEIKDVFHELEAWHIHEKKRYRFSVADCHFGYRESVFKKSLKGQFIILNVTFRLNKQPVFHTSYGAIENELEKMQLKELSIQAISEAVIRIRSSKLPDPAVIGNAGSFFKNPVIPSEQYKHLLQQYPQMPGFTMDDSHTKIPAGWLIENTGWKGYREGDAGCYPKQALVLVNYGQATGQDIFRLSEKIISSIREKFGITLEREVNVI